MRWLIAGHSSGTLPEVGGHERDALLSRGNHQVRALAGELDHLRRVGLAHVQESSVVHIVAALQAHSSSDTRPFAARLEHFLVVVLEPWGDGRAGRAARCIFGLTPHTRRQSPAVRRRAAARAVELSEDYFRKGHEAQLLTDVAVAIAAYGASEAADASAGPAPHSGGGPPWGVRVSTFDEEVEFSLRHLLDGATVVLVHGKSWVNLFNRHLRLVVDVVARGGTVRILLVRPDPGVAVGLYGPSPEVSARILARNVGVALDRLSDVRPEVAALPGALDVRLDEVAPQYGFVGVGRTDAGVDRGVAQLNFVHTRTEADRYVLCLEAGEVLDGFVEEFERAWSQASPWGEGS